MEQDLTVRDASRASSNPAEVLIQMQLVNIDKKLDHLLSQQRCQAVQPSHPWIQPRIPGHCRAGSGDGAKGVKGVEPAPPGDRCGEPPNRTTPPPVVPGQVHPSPAAASVNPGGVQCCPGAEKQPHAEKPTNQATSANQSWEDHVHRTMSSLDSMKLHGTDLLWETLGEARAPIERLAVRFGVLHMFEYVTAQMEVTKKGKMLRRLHGPTAQLIVSLVIVTHAVLTGYSAEVAYQVEVNKAPRVAWLEASEVFFLLFFTVELGVRVLVERFCFLFGREWRWNLLDSVLVTVSIADVVLSESAQSTALASFSVGRFFRLARFFRLMRLPRVMRHCQSLRLILYAILDSMTSLGWCFLLVACFMYGFACLVVYGVVNFMVEEGVASGHGAELHQWWGGMYRSMVTLFMAISGGADWAEMVDPLARVSGIYEPLFIGYIFFMVFGVLNVVVGAFVATTTQIAEEDREAQVKYEMARVEKYTGKIRRFFRDADIDRSGTLSWDEFKQYLGDPKVKAWFQTLELDVSQAHNLFELLDTDGSDQVTVDEFLKGCLRLKGQATTVDLNMVLMTCRKMSENVAEFMRWSAFQNLELNREIMELGRLARGNKV